MSCLNFQSSTTAKYFFVIELTIQHIINILILAKFVTRVFLHNQNVKILLSVSLLLGRFCKQCGHSSSSSKSLKCPYASLIKFKKLRFKQIFPVHLPTSPKPRQFWQTFNSFFLKPYSRNFELCFKQFKHDFRKFFFFTGDQININNLDIEKRNIQ